MKTQISRDSFHADKRYSGIYQQQGRMLVDADWNELVDLVKNRLDEALADVIRQGAPRSGGVLDFSTVPPRIRWGRLYADGIQAELRPRVTPGTPTPVTFDFTRQQDFPGVEAIVPSGNYILYADLWERPVISLEDETLRDPGLHGADTCTRTRTMTQVKWCPVAVDPENAAQNPTIGTAGLDLSLRQTGTGDEAGDPCGGTAGVLDLKTGNYLFRVEVHHVAGAAANPDAVVLKWSAENGAEQHLVRADGALVDTVPPEFKSGDWVYELYSGISETHLGVQHAAAAGFPARFDLIADGYPAVIPNAAQYVRRWDGYCRLTRVGTVWSAAGKDGAVALTQVSSSTGDDIATHGDVKFEAGGVKIFLNNMILSLALDGRTFLAGDFWQAMVRDNTADGDQVQLYSREPMGIRHHYITLARFQAGAMVGPDSTAVRRLSFPPLGNLTADRVGYDPAAVQARWTDIHDNPATPMPLTVQAAIDDLVQNLESSDIAYPLPGCIPALAVRRLLPALQAVADGTRLSIDTILTALLCELRATTLPCSDGGADITTQAALDNRVHKTGDTMSGKLTIQSDLEVSQNIGIGTATPATRLHILSGTDTSPTTPGLMVLGRIDGTNISMDDNEIMARNNNAVAPLHLNHEGGQVIVNGSGNGSLSIGSSDFEARLNVNGTAKMAGFKMTTGPQSDYVLTSDANGVGTWRPATPFGWRVVNNNLVLNSDQITGNVGIGTNDPQAKLYVNGNAGVSGTLYATRVFRDNLLDSVNFYIEPTTTSTSFVEIAGWSATVAVPGPSRLRVVLEISEFSVNGGTFSPGTARNAYIQMRIDTTPVPLWGHSQLGNWTLQNLTISQEFPITAGTHTLRIDWRVNLPQYTGTLKSNQRRFETA